MAEETPGEELASRFGRPSATFDHLARIKFLGLVEAGFGRSLALKECEVWSYRVLTRALREDPDFRAQLEMIERAREESLQLNVYSAAVKAADDDPTLSMAALNMAWKVRAMAEANRARRKAEALAERDMRVKEGMASEGQPDLSDCSPEELDAMARMERGEDLDEAEAVAYARAHSRLARARVHHAAAGGGRGEVPA